MKYLCSLALVAIMLVPVVNAQYRRNDVVHASHEAYESPNRKSPNRTAQTSIGESDVVVEWGAPSVKGREIFGKLIPAGTIWRTGANEATVIHFDNNVLVEGEEIAAGNYALFTIGSAEEFTFIFNSVSQTWGAFSHDEANDVLRVTVPTGEGDHQEELLFDFHDVSDSAATLTLSWATATASISIKLD
jgi:hypothetical protein